MSYIDIFVIKYVFKYCSIENIIDVIESLISHIEIFPEML